jgi:hypothetical protein
MHRLKMRIAASSRTFGAQLQARRLLPDGLAIIPFLRGWPAFSFEPLENVPFKATRGD